MISLNKNNTNPKNKLFWTSTVCLPYTTASKNRSLAHMNIQPDINKNEPDKLNTWTLVPIPCNIIAREVKNVKDDTPMKNGHGLGLTAGQPWLSLPIYFGKGILVRTVSMFEIFLAINMCFRVRWRGYVLYGVRFELTKGFPEPFTVVPL